MQIAVLGAGSWGTALGCVLIENGHDVCVWARNSDTVHEINTMHSNRAFFMDTKLPALLQAQTDMASVVSHSEVVIYAVPSRAVRSVASNVQPYLSPTTVVAHAVKGFDLQTLDRMSQVLDEEHPHHAGRICVIGGPSHAEEVIGHMPTTLVSASMDRTLAECFQDILMNPYLRVYTQSDVVGVELGGSLKNIIALGVGIVDGLGFGDNAKAAVMTRGLAEMARLGERMGAIPQTFAGLAGVGDLIATCTSRHSRNLRAGRLMGQGTPTAQVERKIGMVVEGIPAVDAAIQLAKKHDVDMPITRALHAVIHDGTSPADAVEQLMGRAKRHEAEVEDPQAFW